MITLGLVGLSSCLKSMDKATTGMSDKVKKAIDKKAEDVKNDMVDLAPVLTGAMAGSIGIETKVDKGDIYALGVGPSDDLKSGIPDLPYSVLVEFGGAHGAAQPFVRPAAEMNKPLDI